MELNESFLLGFSALLFICLIFFELYFPERSYDKGEKKRSYLVNILLFGFNNFVLFIFNITAVSAMVYSYHIHDLFLLFPVWLQLVLGIILFDLFIWFWHLINHKSTLLWSFHKCHHSEKYLNTTSSVRFHLGELLLSIGAKSVFLLIIGVPFWIFVLYESLVTIFAAFHHSNIYLPTKIQHILEKVIITPDLHRTHHSAIRSEHDSNYGVIFSFWDKIFSTRNTAKPVEIGLNNTKEKNFSDFLKFPYNKE